MPVRARGTQDMLDMQLYNAIIDHITKVLQQHHFCQIETPIIEPVDLFERILGQASDAVHKEMFLIQPRGESQEPSLCLRPEATAPTARAFIDNAIDQLPWCVYSYGPMFRYERPQKGRYRQFHQCNIEMIGVTDSSYDVQLIAILERLFQRTFCLDEYVLLINYLGTAEDRAAYTQQLKRYLKQQYDQLCELCQLRLESNTLRVLDCKNPVCQQTYEQAPELAQSYTKESRECWDLIQQQLQLLSVSYSINPRLVRGLDYYNGTVFEFISPELGAQATFCAGGRYDGLLSQINPKYSQPACGAAIGLERLLLLLEPEKERFMPKKQPLHAIIPLGQKEKVIALLLADALTQQGLTVELLLDTASMKSLLKKANKHGAQTALFIGQQEREAGTVLVKNMITGQQEQIKQVDVASYLKG